MKRFLPLLVFSFYFLPAFAQQQPTDKMMQEWRQLKQSRTIKTDYKNSNIPLGEALPASKGVKALPEDRVWFPGEWEEVQAIVVTPYYSYDPDTNLGSGYFMADPTVTGLAEYYKYTARGWQSMNIYGPYTSTMDTSSSFGKVFFYLMDGIQKGHAQAWVRVEKATDSAKVLRTLTRLNLRHDNIRFIVGPGNSFWYRDCGPICFYYGDEDSVAMMDFEYYPGRALDDSLPSLITQQMGVPNYINTIEWEGGNCVVDGAGFLLSSDAIYSNNNDTYGQIVWDGHNVSSIHYQTKTRLTQAQTREALRSLLGQRETHILTAYQYDGGTGHVDLYADMQEENGFVFSVMPDVYSSWTDYSTGARNMDSLCAYTSIFNRPYYKSSIPFPSTDNGANFSSQSDYDANYTRTYSNHTFVNDLILQPCFSAVSNGRPTAAWDRNNIEELKKAYPGYTIYPVDVRDFDGSGGAIHCVTKQIPAENPVRILHKSIYGCANAMEDNMPVSAIITNRSGIAHAEVLYRSNGGQWDTLPLTANGNRYYGRLPHPAVDINDTTLNDTTITIEYYISATSNNGKTITKPMTAHQGGYYSYYYTNELDTVFSLDSVMYDFDTTPMPATDITFLFDAQRTHRDTTETHGGDVSIDSPAAEETFGQLYPNPATDQAHIAIDLANGGTWGIQILDNAGRTIHSTRLQSAGRIVFNINTARLGSGVYHVVFTQGSQRIVRKLAVK